MAAEEPRREKSGGGIWDFIKEHAAIIGGAFVGVIALWYLVFQNSASSSAAPSTVTFPPQGGGPPTNLSASTPTTATPTPTLPYSPDFSVLSSITNSALQSLWLQAYNLETQINAATLSGSDTSALQSALAGVMSQIQAFGQPTTPGGSTGGAYATSVQAAQVPGVLSTIWNTFGFEATSNPTAYAQGWIAQAAALFNVPIGVATATWNTINSNPNQYVSQAGAVSPSTANTNIAALLNQFLMQYTANPSAFVNIPTSPYVPIVAKPYIAPTNGGGSVTVTGGTTK